MSLEFIKPQLATLVDQPPPRAGWIHEVKHDAYRTLLIIERRKARAYTRNGFDWSDREHCQGSSPPWLPLNSWSGIVLRLRVHQ